MGQKRWLCLGAWGTICLLANAARADDPARPWEQNPVAIGAHLGVAVPETLGTGSVASRFAVAPTGLLEMSFRLADHYSVGGLVGAGLGTGEGCSDVERARSCQVPVMGLLGGFVRYHLAPSGSAEPWVATGLSGSVLRGPSERRANVSESTVGRGTLDAITTTELGLELLLGGGVSWRANPTTSFGFAVQGLLGPNAYARETRKYSQGAEDSRDLPLTGLHGIFLLSLHLQFHTPS